MRGLSIPSVASTLAIVSIVAGCGSQTQPAQPPPGETTRASANLDSAKTPKNCLFIVLDTTRARRMSLFGYHRPTTPFLESIASESAYFTQARSQATDTPPSTWSFMTGQYVYLPEKNPLNARVYGVRPGVDRLMSGYFRDAGFGTGGFSENPWISEALGFEQGFDTFIYASRKKTPEGVALDKGNSRKVLANATQWMREAGDKPWFCYVHLLRPHHPYAAPEPYLSRFLEPRTSSTEFNLDLVDAVEHGIVKRSQAGRNLPTPDQIAFLSELYDGSVAYADSLLEELFGFLKDENLLEDTLVVVASDHGEAFGEHGRILHGWPPHEELIHVPLIFRAPKDSGFAVGPIDQLVEMVDLLPTFDSIFGLSVGEEVDGESLLPLLRGELTGPHKPATYATGVKGADFSVRAQNLKLIMGLRIKALYNLKDDPLEENNLFTSEEDIPGLVDLINQYRATRITGHSLSTSEIPEETIEELKALGYLD